MFEESEPAPSVRKIQLDSEGGRLFVLCAARYAQFDDASLRSYRILEGKMIWQLHPSRRQHQLEGPVFLALNGKYLGVLNSHAITFLQVETGRVVRMDPLTETSSQGAGRGPDKPAMVYSKQRGELLIYMREALHRVTWPSDQEPKASLERILPLVFPAFDDVTAKKISVAFSSDGNLLVLPMGEHGLLLQATTPAGKLARSLKDSPRDPIPLLAFSPNSKELALIPERGNGVRLTEVSTGKVIIVETGSSKATALAFSEDGKSLLVGCDDSTAQVLDLTKLPAAK